MVWLEVVGFIVSRGVDSQSNSRPWDVKIEALLSDVHPPPHRSLINPHADAFPRSFVAHSPLTKLYRLPV